MNIKNIIKSKKTKKIILTILTMALTLCAVGICCYAEGGEEEKEGAFKQLYKAVCVLTGGVINVSNSVLAAITSAPKITAFDEEFVSLGTTLATFFMTAEILATITRFSFQGFEDAIRFAIKFVICKVIIENTDNITGAIYSTFYEKHGFKNVELNISSVTMREFEDPGILDLNYLIAAIGTILALGFMIAIIVKVIAQIAGVIFEIAVHNSFAPIAMSTLCFEQSRSAGVSFIKSYVAVCSQGLVISICFSVFGQIRGLFATIVAGIVQQAGEQMPNSGFLTLVEFVPIFMSMIILSTAISHASDMTKRMLGA